MPTKKIRVGFIPRSDVLALINKLSYETTLSKSKIINILVEEALFKRGLFNNGNRIVFNENKKNNKDVLNYEKIEILNKEFKYNFKNKLLKDEVLNFEDIEDEPLNKEIYSKFLLFLQFQERMKKRNS
tara:strand:- start:1302 stop:1685 length:384 start_codon:yes stop_codon:yes gene_type:complete